MKDAPREVSTPVPLQFRIYALPAGAEWMRINAELGIARVAGELIVCNAGGAMYRCREDDRGMIRFFVGMLASDGVAKPKELARAFGIDRSMVFEYRDRYRAGGAGALERRPSGPRGGSKLKGEALANAQGVLDAGESNARAAVAGGVSEGAIRAALRTGRLKKPGAGGVAPGGVAELKTPRARNEEDRAGPGGMAVKRHVERGLAWAGVLGEARPVFVAAEGVAKGGVLVALPALVGQGLLAAGEEVYGSLRNGFFGLRSMLLVFALMALLRINVIRQLRSHGPGELGLLLGLDRAPEEKTVRRKLRELAAHQRAARFAAVLGKRWLDETTRTIGLLYVDGHVRPYHGRAHELSKTKVARRGLAMPATTDFWVHDADASPIFFMITAANEHMLQVLEQSLIPDIRQMLGTGRRITLVLDREAWSPNRFRSWFEAGVDVMTYRKGRYEDWPVGDFRDFEVSTSRNPRIYRLAEREVTLSNGFAMREVRRLCDSGKQTSIVTTRRDLPLLAVARNMFARWAQENFFRYMRLEFALDHLHTRAVEPADPNRQVPNPAIKEKQKLRASASGRLGKLERVYVNSTLPDPEATNAEGTRKNAGSETEALASEILALRRQCQALKIEIEALPLRVPVRKLRRDGVVLQLERERKLIMDTIKNAAYRAETELAHLVGPALARFRQEEARNFLKHLFQSTVDLIPDPLNKRLVVRLYGLATKRENQALAALCEILNEQQVCYPGTRLRLVYQPPESE